MFYRTDSKVTTLPNTPSFCWHICIWKQTKILLALSMTTELGIHRWQRQKNGGTNLIRRDDSFTVLCCSVRGLYWFYCRSGSFWSFFSQVCWFPRLVSHSKMKSFWKNRFNSKVLFWNAVFWFKTLKGDRPDFRINSLLSIGQQGWEISSGTGPCFPLAGEICGR